jgi:hypothetical protein
MTDRDLFTEDKFFSCANYVLNALMAKNESVPVRVDVTGINGGTIAAEVVSWRHSVNVLEVPECPVMPVKIAITHADGSKTWAYSAWAGHQRGNTPILQCVFVDGKGNGTDEERDRALGLSQEEVGRFVRGCERDELIVGPQFNFHIR